MVGDRLAERIEVLGRRFDESQPEREAERASDGVAVIGVVVKRGEERDEVDDHPPTPRRPTEEPTHGARYRRVTAPTPPWRTSSIDR